MRRSNKKSGTAFEKEVAKKLHDAGFWVHRMQDNENGQPADIIAVVNEEAYLIDCKDCHGVCFEYSRIEPNQQTAMQVWRECGNGEGYFAIRFCGKNIYMMQYRQFERSIAEGCTGISAGVAACVGIKLDEWIRLAGGYIDETDNIE